MKTLRRFVTAAFVLAFAAPAAAADITVLCSNGLRAVTEELVPRFEQATGDRVVLKYAPSSQLRQRIEAGEPFDLAVLTTATIDREIQAGRLTARSRTIIARSGLGLSIRAGAKKPDIRSVDAFRNALLEADSITFARQGASAATFETLVAKLGITAKVRPKYYPEDTAAEVGEAVASGRVEIGVAPVSEILPVRGVDLVGPFPKEIQSYVEMTAAVGTNATQKDAAARLIAYLTSPANLVVIQAKGMESSTSVTR